MAENRPERVNLPENIRQLMELIDKVATAEEKSLIAEQLQIESGVDRRARDEQRKRS